MDEKRMRNVDSIAMISPNFGPKDESGKWLTRPGGPIIGRLLVGGTRDWQAHNDLQERYWSTSYPTSTLVEVMRLVDRANAPPSRIFSGDILMLYSPDDEVVSSEAFLGAFEKLSARYKQAIAVEGAEDPYQHVLAGRILSPGKTDDVVATIVEFVAREN